MDHSGSMESIVRQQDFNLSQAFLIAHCGYLLPAWERDVGFVPIIWQSSTFQTEMKCRTFIPERFHPYFSVMKRNNFPADLQ
jgi:hypothetical protein